jgi:hypothetical protein
MKKRGVCPRYFGLFSEPLRAWRLGEKSLFAVLVGAGDPESLAKAQRTQREKPRSFINAGTVPGASASKISNHHSTIINQIQKSPIRLAYARMAVLVPPSG